MTGTQASIPDETSRTVCLRLDRVPRGDHNLFEFWTEIERFGVTLMGSSDFLNRERGLSYHCQCHLSVTLETKHCLVVRNL